MTLIKKVIRISIKIPIIELRNPKKPYNEKPLAYVATYSKNNLQPFIKSSQI